MNDDSRIIGLFFERSEQAIAKLSERYGERCRRVARNIVASDEDADECVSDAFLAVWERIPPERPDPLVTYLLKIVRNTAIKKLRSNTALKRGRGYDAALDELEECLPSGESVEGELEARELRQHLARGGVNGHIAAPPDDIASLPVNIFTLHEQRHRLKACVKRTAYHLRAFGYEYPRLGLIVSQQLYL